jgi:hypothetical protein
MEASTKWSLAIYHAYMIAYFSTKSVILSGRKWTVLFGNLSIVTHIASCPVGDLGNFTMKSIAT